MQKYQSAENDFGITGYDGVQIIIEVTSPKYGSREYNTEMIYMFFTQKIKTRLRYGFFILA